MRLAVKNKLKIVLQKIHILGVGKKFYKLHYKKRHKRHMKEAKKRNCGWKDSRYNKLKELHNSFLGKRCFVVCTGPSLTINDINLLKNEYTFSMNSIFKLFDKTDWRPSFYVIQDEKVYDKLKDDETFKGIKNKFVADFIFENIDVDKTKNIMFPIDLLNHRDYDNKIFDTEFSDNAYNIVYDGGTVTYSIFQIAYYLGFREIYLLGCDCDYSGTKQHFADYGIKVNDSPESRMIIGYQVANDFTKKSDLKIFNATRGGKLEVYTRVNLDDIVKEVH